MIHFIGIGGSGMSAVAKVLLDRGIAVSGSDLAENDATRSLQAAGAVIYVGHAPSNLTGVSTVVVSSAISASNPELVAARELGLPILHRAEMLAQVVSENRGVAVAGSHGKTTTTAMIAHVLLAAGLDPTVVIGGTDQVLASNARAGAGELAVIEADESDRSFLKLNPWCAIVTNIEDDHLETYGSLAAMHEAYETFLHKAARVVLCGDDPRTLALAAACNSEVITYGFADDRDVRGGNFEPNGFGSTLECHWSDGRRATLQLRVPGRHNALNALAAAAVGRLAGADVEAIAQGLATFRGVRRRLERIREGSITILDDYAHHPTEIRATLASVKRLAPSRLLAIFQPHRYSRLSRLFEEFVTAFAGVDRLWITDVYGAGEDPLPDVSGVQLASRIRQRFGRAAVEYAATPSDAATAVAQDVRSGDFVITLGAGDIRRAALELDRYLSNRGEGA